jgi:anaerobic selenocysteine-containing dehydrogenase
MTANEVAPRRRTCPLCEAMCGLTLEVSGDRVLAVRGDPEDAFSRGYICPKAVGLMDVHHDPDRLGNPSGAGTAPGSGPGGTTPSQRR